MAWSLTLLVCTFIARLLGIGDAQFKDERGGRDATRGDNISAFRRGALRRKWVVSFRVPISVANSPPTQSTLGNGTAAGVFGLPELGDWPWDPHIRRIEGKNSSISKNPGMSRDLVLSKTPMRNIQTACCRC
jgi:hypothetical protein